MARLNSENCRICECWQFALYWHLPTSGRQNTVKKGPQPLFVPKAFFPLCIPAFPAFMAHHNISLRIWAGGRRVKKNSFHEFPLSLAKKNRRPAADSILMLPTFPIARLNRYAPDFSGLTQKLTWCQKSNNFPGQPVTFVIDFLKAMSLKNNLSCLEPPRNSYGHIRSHASGSKISFKQTDDHGQTWDLSKISGQKNYTLNFTIFQQFWW